MRRKSTFDKYNAIRAKRPKAQTGQIDPAGTPLLNALSDYERQQAYLKAVDAGLIQPGHTTDPAVIAQQNAAVEQMLQQEAAQNPTISAETLSGATSTTTPPPSMATPGIIASGARSGMGGVNAEMRLQEELASTVANTNVTLPSGGGLGDSLGNVDLNQAAKMLQQVYPTDPKTGPDLPNIDPNDPSAAFNTAAADYNQLMEQMKQVDGTTDPMESMIGSFAGGSNASTAKDIGGAASKAGATTGKTGLSNFGATASKAAPILAAFQAFGGFMEGGVNDQDPTTYTAGEIAADAMQLKFGEMIRQSKQRKYFKDLQKKALEKRVDAGVEDSRMQEDAAVRQRFTGRTYTQNTGPETRFNYESGGIKKLRGGVEIDLGRPDVGAVLLKGATHEQGGIDHGDVEAENNEVYTKMKINNPATGKTEEAGYYFSEFLKGKNGKSFAKQALEAIKKNKDTKSLEKELSSIAAANEEKAKKTGEMNRDKKYIARYGKIGKKMAQTGEIDFAGAGLDVEYAPNLGAPGIELVQPGKGGGFYGDAELNAFRDRFTNAQLPEYLRTSAAALMPRNKESVGQFQSDYNRYLGELYDQTPGLGESMTRDEFIISQGFNPTMGPGPSTLDRMFGEYTATRPIFTKRAATEKLSSLPLTQVESGPIDQELKVVEEGTKGKGKGKGKGEGEGEEEAEEELPMLPDIKDRNLPDLAPYGQLIPPIYGLMNPYQKTKGTDITSGVALPRMPRVNLEGDRTKAIDTAATQFEAARQAGLGPGSSGVSDQIAAGTGETIRKISNAQSKANLQLAGQETTARLQASMFNTRSLTNQKQFNKRLEQIENQYGREEKLELLDTLFERIQGIKNAKDQKKAMDNYIDILDEYDTLDRKGEVKAQIKARDKAQRKGAKTPPYWNEEEGRYITDLEIRKASARKFPALPMKKGGIDRKKKGGYYIGRLGALKNKR